MSRRVKARLNHISIILLNTYDRRSPLHLIFDELLKVRLQSARYQIELIHSTQPHDVHAGKAAGDTVQQRSAGLAEVAIHLIARVDVVVAFVFGEVGLAF